MSDRCSKHDAGPNNLAFYTCGCRRFAPPPERCPYGSGEHRKAREILRARTWHVGMQGATLPVPVAVVLVSGAVGDYAVYLGVGDPEWVRAHGDKLRFEDAAGLFPGLDERKYR